MENMSAELRKLISEKSNEELLQMVVVDSGEYRDDALELARTELRQRKIEGNLTQKYADLVASPKFEDQREILKDILAGNTSDPKLSEPPPINRLIKPKWLFYYAINLFCLPFAIKLMDFRGPFAEISKIHRAGLFVLIIGASALAYKFLLGRPERIIAFSNHRFMAEQLEQIWIDSPKLTQAGKLKVSFRCEEDRIILEFPCTPGDMNTIENIKKDFLVAVHRRVPDCKIIWDS
jgi:hypothetical protein